MIKVKADGGHVVHNAGAIFRPNALSYSITMSAATIYLLIMTSADGTAVSGKWASVVYKLTHEYQDRSQTQYNRLQGSMIPAYIFLAAYGGSCRAETLTSFQLSIVVLDLPSTGIAQAVP